MGRGGAGGGGSIFQIVVALIALGVALFALATFDNALPTGNFTAQQNTTRSNLLDAETTIFSILIAVVILSALVLIINIVRAFG